MTPASYVSWARLAQKLRRLSGLSIKDAQAGDWTAEGREDKDISPSHFTSPALPATIVLSQLLREQGK